jgi:D-aspartate ligase
LREPRVQLVPAIVAGCSKAGLAIIRALGSHNVPIVGVGYGRGQIGLGSRFVRERVRSPDPAMDEAGFLDCLQAVAERWAGAVLFPSDDGSLVTLSRNKPLLSRNFRVVAERWHLVRSLIDKQHTYEVARFVGVPCPRLQLVRDVADARAFAREIGFPCLLKPTVGHLFFKAFARKMLMAHSPDELERGLQAVRDYPGEVMLCEFIPGPDTCSANYNSFCVAGQPVQEFTAQKVRMSPTSIGFPTVVHSQHMPAVLSVGRRMAAALGYDGFSCMEFKLDSRDGAYKLMEVNGRHNYSGQLASACGIDFPLLSYLAAQNVSLPVVQSELPELFWIDEERDIRGALRVMLRRNSAVRAYFEPYRRPNVYAVFSRSDPMPSLRLAADSVARALRRHAARSEI